MNEPLCLVEELGFSALLNHFSRYQLPPDVECAAELDCGAETSRLSRMKCFEDDASTRVFFSFFSLHFVASAVIRSGHCAFILTLTRRGSKQLLIHSNLRVKTQKTNNIKTYRGSCCRPSESSALSNQIFLFCLKGRFKVVSAALTQFESWFGSVFIAACLPPPLHSSGLH